MNALLKVGALELILPAGDGRAVQLVRRRRITRTKTVVVTVANQQKVNYIMQSAN
jgi:hypothetical protein